MAGRPPVASGYFVFHQPRLKIGVYPWRRRWIWCLPFQPSPVHDYPGEFTVSTDTSKSSPKAQLDVLLLKLHGVSARKINGLDAYFVSDRMFACISGNGVGLRLPSATATELHFSRDNISPFQPRGIPATREWIQIDRADAADYAKDLELFQTSIDFVKTGGR